MPRPAPKIVVQKNGCWLRPRAYCKVVVNGKRDRTYRHFYRMRFGEIPAGLELDHLCRDPRCVNPEHLEAVTHAENLRRGSSTKLTRDAVLEIRRRAESGELKKTIATDFKVHASHVGRIVSKVFWKEG